MKSMMELKMRKEKKALWQVNKRFYFALLYFFIVFISSVFVLSFLYDKYDLLYLRIITAEIVSFLLNEKNIGSIIEISRAGFYIDIIKECVGFKTFIFFFSLILATPFVSWKRKVLFLILSPIMSFIINILRILFSILFTYFTKPDFYTIYDSFIFSVFTTSAILVIWYFSLAKHISGYKGDTKVL